ncbi:MAG TPA: hypothetical protein VFW22_13090 [Pseudolabrys sp.]|nr:hypothetical protein [Pseudolabrys sp.]
MPKLIAIVLVAATCGVLGASQALAIEVGSAACKRELRATQKLMQESAALVDSGMKASGAERCTALSRHLDLAETIRESFARCEEPKVRTSAVRDADEVIEASHQAYNRWCPARPGMVRVRMTMVETVTRDKLPKSLAAVHRCAEDGVPMFSTNERFDLGRLIALGCPGNANPAPDEIKARNAKADLLRREQAMYYVTRDRDGDDPRRLTFPILDAEGHEAMTDRLFASRVSIGEKPDLISSFWEPAKDGVCRVHAIWRVADGKAALVFWGEATDCAPGAKTEFKTVIDRR